MVKDVFYINELFVQFNELDSRCMAMVIVRSHLVRNPKLSYSHDEGKSLGNYPYFLGFLKVFGRPLDDPCFAGNI